MLAACKGLIKVDRVVFVLRTVYPLGQARLTSHFLLHHLLFPGGIEHSGFFGVPSGGPTGVSHLGNEG